MRAVEKNYPYRLTAGTSFFLTLIILRSSYVVNTFLEIFDTNNIPIYRPLSISGVKNVKVVYFISLHYYTRLP